MCGIFGQINFDRKPIPRENLERMALRMQFRGPDGVGYYQNENVGMGMCRLAIVDLKTGMQPLFYKKRGLSIVLNGEIYNFKELRIDLERDGYQFQTNSDVEVVLYLYDKHGKNCLSYLNGMFSFAIYDEQAKSVFIARDRLGIKPLYYFNSGKSFIFSSNLYSILDSDPNLQFKLSRSGLLSYFLMSNIGDRLSICDGIFKLEPGHFLLIQNNNVQDHCYWSVEGLGNLSMNEQEYLTENKLLLTNAIGLTMRSDVPVGAYLSGGIDSSLVSTLAQTQSHIPMEVFSADFEEKEDSEKEYAEMVANRIGAKLNTEIINKQRFQTIMEKLMPFLDEPISDSAIVPTFLLSQRAAAKGIKVLLSGAGGDELYGGYARHYKRATDRLFGIAARYPGCFNLVASILDHPLKMEIHHQLSGDGRAILSTSGASLTVLLESLKHEDDREFLVGELRSKLMKLKQLMTTHGFSKGRMIFDLLYYLPNNILALTDKASMAASIEARVPLLDHRLIELMIRSMPSSLLLKTVTKNPLRRTCPESLPSEIWNRKKVGFNAPIGKWMMQATADQSGVRPLLSRIFHENMLSKRLGTTYGASELQLQIDIFQLWLRNAPDNLTWGKI